MLEVKLRVFGNNMGTHIKNHSSSSLAMVLGTKVSHTSVHCTKDNSKVLRVKLRPYFDNMYVQPLKIYKLFIPSSKYLLPSY